jgi:hypothetical protein
LFEQADMKKAFKLRSNKRFFLEQRSFQDREFRDSGMNNPGGATTNPAQRAGFVGSRLV